ncbi:hypothetical protein [Bradyrhizobium japonicum]|uniref:hypothetical protein n=1 Tax=Bradyrhizobium japonicum TaxID=375 RepID=UPI0004B53940|nr:hypothetical protein [Bradyrhizobium japonicum]MCD9819813.1 hypothetical protein [Bradyrhizobium japonicum]MEB2675142.1 hypothetical protein [Bradyrhizobium japonicum]WLB25015.1 hypothetical protein QIH85_24360 [Bradyrhizobium japonicum]WRI85519.1 hypothetical protein R3F75_26425 [Bradyrhizobium japonicum]
MRPSPSIVPADRLDRDIYLVLEDFGARAGCAWRETDEVETDFEDVLQNLLSGQYAYPVRIVSFNPVEGWSRDATSDVADALAQRAADADAEISSALQDFIAANATRHLDMQLALPLRGVASRRNAG